MSVTLTKVVGQTFVGLDMDQGDEYIADRVSFYLDGGQEIKMYSLNGQGVLESVSGNLEDLIESPITHATESCSVFTGDKTFVFSTAIGSVEFVWADGDVGQVGVY